MLLKICEAQLSGCANSTNCRNAEQQRHWSVLLSEANEAVAVVQHWKATYIEATNSMCTYVAFLAASVLLVNQKADFASSTAYMEEHIDLLLLFLDRIGLYWPIGMSLISTNAGARD